MTDAFAYGLPPSSATPSVVHERMPDLAVAPVPVDVVSVDVVSVDVASTAAAFGRWAHRGGAAPPSASTARVLVPTRRIPPVWRCHGPSRPRIRWDSRPLALSV